ERTGNTVLEFDGKMLATKAIKAKRGASRWHAASIYRTIGDNLVIEIAYNTKIDDEIRHYFGKVTSPHNIGEDFNNYDPTSNVFITPEEVKSGLTQDHIEKELRVCYGEMVRLLLMKVNIVEIVS
ncbi:unnamed protein product, partial [marine sediment metagenome]